MTVIPIQKWTFPDRKSSHLSRSNSDLDGGGSSSDKAMVVVGANEESSSSSQRFVVEFVAEVLSISSLRVAVEEMSGAARSLLAEVDMVVMMLRLKTRVQECVGAF